jgi:prolyl-tRNA editing enzyme YbaK/EbsC (Cys-tRNA(Pro) deacylase)
MSLSKSAKSVQEALQAKGVDARVVELPDSTRSAEEAAKAIGCLVGQIVKSLIFCTVHTRRPILVLASGPNRVNEKKIAQYVGEDIAKATADFTREVTGFAIGGIPPVGHKQSIPTYIDEDLMNYQEIWAAAGTPHAVFNMHASKLVELTSGEIVSIK